MNKITRQLVLIGILLVALGMSCTASTLTDYVNKPDSSYDWKANPTYNSKTGSKTVIDMTSQTWQGITWKHKIVLYEPAKCEYPDTLLLFITGNYRENGTESMLGQRLALNSGSPVAVLYDIPNQPLFDGRTEDALIAYTLMKYLETNDLTWPLHLPMTKSSIRAMDTLQSYYSSKPGRGINKFVVCGASKRGWTTWLTAAADPMRVKGIMPMVYDNLNLAAQMKRQIVSFGNYSAQINDYTENDLPKILSENKGQTVASIIDPWSYRKILQMPKLVINGSNDPYWPLDALNIYWKDLNGPKSVLYMMNSGHGLVDNDTDGRKLDTLINSMSVFTRSIASGIPVPVTSWKYITRKVKTTLSITADPSKYNARIWIAKSASRDFRESRWEASDMQANKTGFTGSVDLPRDRYLAVIGQVSRLVDGRRFTTSTQVQIFDNKGPVK